MTEFVLAQEADASAIARLRQKAWEQTYRDIYPAEMIDDFDYGWHTRQDLARIKGRKYLVYLLMENKRPIGYLNLKVEEPLVLQSLYVLKEYQRRGIGKQAFVLIHRICLEREIAVFICQCQPQNKPAMAFYHAMGGVITDRDENNAEAWQNSVTFSFSIYDHEVL